MQHIFQQIKIRNTPKMVKKISQPAPKIEKNQQLNCLTKVLKPKVCITDISNFKRLVHELTGNGSHQNTPTKQPENHLDQTHIADLIYDQEAAVSVDASLDSSEWCNYQPYEDHLVQTNHNDTSYLDDAFLDDLSVNQQMGNFFDQSWMFGAEEPSPSFFNGYAQHIEQEVSIYDYGYSG